MQKAGFGQRFQKSMQGADFVHRAPAQWAARQRPALPRRRRTPTPDPARQPMPASRLSEIAAGLWRPRSLLDGLPSAHSALFARIPPARRLIRCQLVYRMRGPGGGFRGRLTCLMPPAFRAFAYCWRCSRSRRAARPPALALPSRRAVGIRVVRCSYPSVRGRSTPCS